MGANNSVWELHIDPHLRRGVDEMRTDGVDMQRVLLVGLCDTGNMQSQVMHYNGMLPRTPHAQISTKPTHNSRRHPKAT